MAANRFATMVHRNTNKITLILIYAVLEWVLIVLLLLNSLFSYLILKFAIYFGLKPPCLWCTRIDHVFGGGKNLQRVHHLCEAHAKEVSRLGFCSSHQKLVESRNLCEDCLPSSEFEGSSRNAVLFSDNGEVKLMNCSCCGVSLDCKEHASCAVLKTSSWDVMECAQRVNLVREAGENDDEASEEDTREDQKVCDEFDGHLEVTEKGCDAEAVEESKGEDYDQRDAGLGDEEEKEAASMKETSDLIMKDKSVQVCLQEDACVEVSAQHLEFCLDYSGHTLVPIESNDSASENRSNKNDEIEDDDKVEVGEVLKEDAFIDVDINEKPQCFMEIEEDENSLVFHPKTGHLSTDEFEDFGIFPLDLWPSEEAYCVQELAEASIERRQSEAHSDDVACEELARESNVNEADVSIGTEIPDLDIADEVQIQEQGCILDDPSVSSADPSADEDRGPKLHLEPSEMEEEKVPDTPTSVESLNQLHKKLLMLEIRDLEESVDGSVTSELEGSEGVVTIEHLKTALRAERKALQALYAELEEERSASAVAANQTMAMITRLQEEKAAMQMEALQYQRMMEEQSEYDQEALQLLNELMVKREKEKQELERELAGYRMKLLDYETKERMRALKRSKDGSSHSGSSSSEDSDGLSIDLNQEAKEEEGFCSHTPVEAVVNVEECLADFEEERLSILEQLKVLEEKLLTLDEDGHDRHAQHFEDVIEMEDFNGEANVHSNGYTYEATSNGNPHHHHHHRHHKGRSLLPLFDATVDENGGAVMNGNKKGFDHSGTSDSSEMQNKKLAVEGEVDHLYERLQALEADREFLKHCIASLKKGDKGMDLLQEILRHLRDLRSVELRVKSMSDTTLHC